MTASSSKLNFTNYARPRLSGFEVPIDGANAKLAAGHLRARSARISGRTSRGEQGRSAAAPDDASRL